MTGKESRFANLTSVNKFDFRSPYDGGSKASLLIRQRPSDGLGAIFSITKGQIICSSSGSIKVKLDDKPLVIFTARAPSDYSSTDLFITPAHKFVDELKKAKRTLVEVAYYQLGLQVSEFNTEKFEWAGKATIKRRRFQYNCTI